MASPPFVGEVHPVFHSHPRQPASPLNTSRAPRLAAGSVLVVQLSEWEKEDAAQAVADFIQDYRGFYYEFGPYWKKVLSISPELCFIALHEGRILGLLVSIFCDDDRRTCWVATYFVRVEFRGQGIGRALWGAMWTALGFAAGSGAARPATRRADLPLEYFGLTTSVTNPMVRVYESYGFEILGEGKRTGKTEWDQVSYGGFIIESELQKLEPSLSAELSKQGLELRVAGELSDTLLAFDERHCALERSRFLRTLTSSHCEIVECVDCSKRLVGYSIVLEHPTINLVLLIICNPDQGTFEGLPLVAVALLLHQCRQLITANTQTQKALMVHALRGSSYGSAQVALFNRLGLKLLCSYIKMLRPPESRKDSQNLPLFWHSGPVPSYLFAAPFSQFAPY